MLTETRRAIPVASAALVGAVVNGGYSAGLLARFADAGVDPGAREVLESSVTLGLAWTLLLLWVVVHPIRGRFVLPFTGAAVLLGNALHSYSMVQFSGAGWPAAAVNLAVGLGIAALFVVAYRLGSQPAHAP